MSWVDEEGVKSDRPDNWSVDPDSDPKDILARFVVLLSGMGWSYRKIGLVFNRDYETIRKIGQLTISPDPKKQKNLGRKIKREPREVDDAAD